jgi:Sec-independent protein translocase protein TatA
VFEGLFAPSHLIILAIVIFIVIGPRKIADRFHRAGDRLQHLGDDDEPTISDAAPDRPPAHEEQTTARPAAYQLGRWLRGRHQR